MPKRYTTPFSREAEPGHGLSNPNNPVTTRKGGHWATGRPRLFTRSRTAVIAVGIPSLPMCTQSGSLGRSARYQKKKVLPHDGSSCQYCQRKNCCRDYFRSLKAWCPHALLHVHPCLLFRRLPAGCSTRRRRSRFACRRNGVSNRQDRSQPPRTSWLLLCPHPPRANRSACRRRGSLIC